MELYLVQHGEATSRQENADRPLTEVGRGAAARVARFLAEAGLTVGAVYHSGKLRARETAQILASHLTPGTVVSSLAGLDPTDDPLVVLQAIEGLEQPPMLVGHLPHLSRLAALLLTGGTAREPVAFENAGVACLSGEAAGAWRLRWIVTPRLIPPT